MQNEEAMCYITYAVPARLLPNLPLGERVMPIESVQEEPPMLYPEGLSVTALTDGMIPT